ncbi:MAG: tetratricopeptide repeat protein [Candidatus Obscuribacterales bacterium]|nr:tetratricopeptide repeat protein [Candidatus Obscuribacterales bacterium]
MQLQARAELMRTVSLTLVFSGSLLCLLSPASAFESWQDKKASVKNAIEQSKFALASKTLEEALSKADEIGASDVDREEILLMLTLTNFRLGKSKLGRQYLALAEQKLGETSFTKDEQIRAFIAIGFVYMHLGDASKAADYFSKAHELVCLGEQCNQLGLAYLECGKLEESEGMLKSALRLLERDGKPRSDLLSAVYHNLALLYREKNRLVEAEQFSQESLRRLPLSPSKERTNVVACLASIYRLNDNRRKAEELLQAEISSCEMSQEKRSSQLSVLLSALGSFYLEEGSSDRALPLYYRALRLDKALSNSSRLRSDFDDLAWCFFKKQEFLIARYYLRKKILIEEATWGRTDCRLLGSLKGYLKILEQLDAKEEAKLVSGRIGAIMMAPACEDLLKNLQPSNLDAALPSLQGYLDCLSQAGLSSEKKRISNAIQKVRKEKQTD